MVKRGFGDGNLWLRVVTSSYEWLRVVKFGYVWLRVVKGVTGGYGSYRGYRWLHLVMSSMSYGGYVWLSVVTSS